MLIRVIRGQCVRLVFIVVVRAVAITPAEGAPKAMLRVAVFLLLWVVAYVWWLLSGRGPWRWLGLNTAPVAPRGLPVGAFWRVGAERFPWPPDVA